MKAMRVKITSTPEGQAPEKMRQGWVGLRLNGVVYESGMLVDEAPEGFEGFVTLIDDAIAALSLHNKEAFLWWYSWRYGRIGSDVFLFESTCYDVIDLKREDREFVEAFRGRALEELSHYIMKH